MNVFLVYKEDYPWDVRVEKIALALKEDGHSVTIIANNIKKSKKHGSESSISIKRLPRWSWLPFKLRKILYLPVWFNPLWLYALLKYSKRCSKPIFIIRDLPLVKTGLISAKLRGGSTIFDMAEVYPEMYASSKQFSERSIFSNLIKNPSLAESYEKSIIYKVDHTLVMIEESRDRLIAMQVPESRISIVSNTPPVSKYQKITHKHEGTFLHIVYVGYVTRLRGLDLLIEGVKQFVELGYGKDDIRVDIVGKGNAKSELVDLVARYHLGECVKIHGWLEQEEVDSLLSAANVGALTYRVCGHWNHTIPNKIFDYMLSGIPVLTTAVIPITRIIESTECGLICDANDVPMQIAHNLDRLRSPKLRANLGRNGHDAILEQYNWERDKSTLIRVISSVATDETESRACQSS